MKNNPPQTFEEWWATYRDERQSAFHDWIVAIKAAFAAGVASQQAEIERLKERVLLRDASIKQLQDARDGQRFRAERYEAVVEAAREAEASWRDHPLGCHAEMIALRAALAALDKKEKK